MNVVRGELQIIRDDLHANAVRICGAEISRVMSVAEAALQHGLEAWLCPELFEHDPEQTLQYIAEAAHATEGMRRDWPGQVVLSPGTELTLFMQGIFEGDHVTERISRPSFLQRITDGTHNPPPSTRFSLKPTTPPGRHSVAPSPMPLHLWNPSTGHV